MNIVFMGTPDFSVPSVEKLLKSKHKILSVVTAPDKQRGRGRKISFSPIKEFALKNNLPVLQPEKLKDNNQYDPLVAYNGKIYLETDEKINYGISKVISTETIDLFLKKYQNKFSEEGYLPIRFFKTK